MLRLQKDLPHNLLGWYDSARREMPWRGEKDPYRIWLSEMMLQQTQVETVKPYYHKFLERFPTVEALAGAELQEVLATWAGLGYYRRAKHLHLTAQQVVREFGGRFPETVEGLMGLAGIGRYTAGAVASIAFNVAAPVLDGNVMRVLARVLGYEGDVAQTKNLGPLWEVVEGLHEGQKQGSKVGQKQGLKGGQTGGGGGGEGGKSEGRRGGVWGMRGEEMSGRHGDLNQALMELGALVCTPPPSRPRCEICPLREFCVAAQEGRQMELPVKRKKGQVREVRGVAVVMVRSGKRSEERPWKMAMKDTKDTKRGFSLERAQQEQGARSGKTGEVEVLLVQRAQGGTWEGMWEFPVVVEKTGSKNDGEAARGVAVELAERWGLGGGRARLMGRVAHQLTHRVYQLDVVRVEVRRDIARGNFTTKARRHEEVMDVAGLGAGYVGARWVRWPMGEKGKLPMARLVGKVAEVAGV